MNFIKSVWTVFVNIGWLVIGIYLAIPYLQSRYSVVPVVLQPIETTPHEVAAVPETPVKEPVVQPEPRVIVEETPIPKAEPKKEEKPTIGFDRPDSPKKEDVVRETVQPPERAPEQPQPVVDLQPWRVDAPPQVMCEGGQCDISPRYLFTGAEGHELPEPKIDFPIKQINGYEDPSHSRARYTNEELRSRLNDLKYRLKWTPRIFNLLDLSKVGGCPGMLHDIQAQNNMLEWRIRQINLIIQGYAPEDPPSQK
jgi:hypothetical protein